MRIIFISKNQLNDEIITNNLSQISEQDSIKFVHSYTTAEDFINNHIIKNKISVDLIILENNINIQKATEFFDKITKDNERTYSNNDFKFYSIPVVLLIDDNENKNAYKGYRFSDVLINIGVEKLFLFIPELISSVKTWRKNVLDELDNLGIKFNSGSINYDYFLFEKLKRNIHTDILSENFKMFPRRLKYDWLFNNDKQIEQAIDKFIKEFKKTSRLDKKKEEKKFHKLFNKYPFLLKRDNYNQHWYEPRLYYNNENYFEPDYALQPNFNQKTDLSILEIKLPNEGFITKNKFHPKPYKSIIDHIFQVNDYKEFLESEQYQESIIKIFGYIPDNVEYNILVGRLDEKTKNFKVFNNRMRQMNALHINFITYDELLDYQVKYLDRMKILKLL